MLLVIAVLVCVTVAAAVAVARSGPKRIVYGLAPDRPCGFGYKMAWIAVRTSDTAAVCAALDLQAGETANWNSGIGSVYDDQLGATRLFVTPPVGPWTFVVGLSLPPPAPPTLVDKSTPLLLELSRKFGEVQYYFSYPALDLFAWARAVDGSIARAFAVNDEGVIWNRGRTTREEKALGLKLFELRGVRGRKGDAGGEIILHPTEDHVMRLARAWSLDPTQLGPASGAEGVGIIAHAPSTWRPQRMRRSA